MKSAELEPVPPALERLFEYERVVAPASTELRARALSRARAALRAGDGPRVRAFGSRRRVPLLLAAALVLAAAAVAAWQARWRAEDAKVPGAPPPSRIEVAQRVLPVHTVAEAPAVAPELASQGASAAGETVSRGRSNAAAARPPVERDLDALELEMLQRARRALANAEFSSALAEAAEHQRRFPAGRLREEREALRVKALLGLGRVAEARAAAERFRKHYPRSVLAPRIDEALRRAP